MTGRGFHFAGITKATRNPVGILQKKREEKKGGKFSSQQNRVASIRIVNRRLSRVAYPAEQFVFSPVFSEMRFNIYAAPGHARIMLFNICGRTKKVNSHYTAERTKGKIHKYARASVYSTRLIKSTIVNSSRRRDRPIPGRSSKVRTLRRTFPAEIANLIIQKLCITIIESHRGYATTLPDTYFAGATYPAVIAIDPPPRSPPIPLINVIAPDRSVSRAEQRRERAKERPRVSAKFCRAERVGRGGGGAMN